MNIQYKIPKDTVDLILGMLEDEGFKREPLVVQRGFDEDMTKEITRLAGYILGINATMTFERIVHSDLPIVVNIEVGNSNECDKIKVWAYHTLGFIS